MNPWFLYAIPVIWILAGILYANTFEGFAASTTAAMAALSGFALLIGVVAYHVTKKVFWSIVSIPIIFVLLFFLVSLLDRIIS